MKFRIALFLARLGFFRYENYDAFGMRDEASSPWPMARVRYPSYIHWGQVVPEGYSVPMAIGNAVEYAKIFGGEIVPLTKRAT